jgi:hypothetical protein
VSEPTADTSAPRVFKAVLHLTRSDYREGLQQLPLMWGFRWLAVLTAVAAVAATVLGIETTDTQYVVPLYGLPLLVLAVPAWFVPDLLAWQAWRTSPFGNDAMVRLDTEQIAYAGQQASLSYTWPLISKAVETHSAFHLVASKGMSTAICILPKRAFLLEDHMAIRELITSKVGGLRRR